MNKLILGFSIGITSIYLSWKWWNNKTNESEDLEDKRQNKQSKKAIPEKCIVISAHGDTNWKRHQLSILTENGRKKYYGHMDNFVGVFITMFE